MWFRFKNDRWRAVAKPWAIAGALIFSLTVGSAPGPAVGALPPVVFGQFEALAILAPSPLVRRIQELLTELGEYDGPADGRMNDDTLAAVKGYQRQSGLDDDGRVTQALIDHIEFTGRAIELGEKVERIRAGQIDVAEQALMTRPETRALLEANFDDERADPTRDVSKCFAAPDARCLLEETLNSAKSVNRDRFRDWVLGEIVVAQAQAGLVAAAMDTAARIGDPRLIIVALGNMASAEAQSGAVDQALAAARVIPDPWARAKALAAVVAAMAAAGNPPGHGDRGGRNYWPQPHPAGGTRPRTISGGPRHRVVAPVRRRLRPSLGGRLRSNNGRGGGAYGAGGCRKVSTGGKRGGSGSGRSWPGNRGRGRPRNAGCGQRSTPCFCRPGGRGDPPGRVSCRRFLRR